MRTFTTNEYKNSPLYQNNPGNLPNKGEDWGGKVPKALRKVMISMKNLSL